MCDVGYEILDIRYWILDVGFVIRDTRCGIHDIITDRVSRISSLGSKANLEIVI
jgi:hypothetical protein